MKKRYIFATATMLMGSAIFVELKTGWLFGSETAAAETGFVRAVAAVATAPAPQAAGRAPVFVVIGDIRSARAKPATEIDEDADEKPDGSETTASSRAVADATVGSGFDQQLPSPLWIAGAGGWTSDSFGGDIEPGGFGGGGVAGGINPDEAILRSAGTNLISTVPEPETWISLIAGLFLVAINMRRRRALPSVAS